MWLLVLSASAVASAWLGFGIAAPARIALWQQAGVWLVGAGMLAAPLLSMPDWAPALRRLRHSRTRAPDLAALGVLLVVGLAMLRLVRPEMRIQADESALVGTSFGLHLIGLPLVPSAGYYDAQGQLHALAMNADKRGLLFPMLMWLMHALFGYSPEHGLRLNALLTLAIPALAYAGLRRTLAPAAALAGALLLLVHPVLVWCGASSGFEPANVAVLLACWLAVQSAARSESARRWLLVAVLGALASQARYESVLFGAVMFALAAWAFLRQGPTRWRLALPLVPLMFLPFAWQRAIAFEHGLGGIGGEPFALAYLWRNLGHAATLFALRSSIEPVAPALAILAAVAIFAAVRNRNAARAAAALPELAVAAAVPLLMLPILVYTWGDLADPVTMRLGLPLMILMSLLSGFGLAVLSRRWPALSAPALAALLVALAVPATRNDSAGRRQVVGMAENTVVEWARATAPRCRPLIVEQYPNYFLAFGYSGLPPESLDSFWPQVRGWAQQGAIDAVWFVEATNLGTGEVLPHHRVPEGFGSEPLYAVELPGAIGLRILALDRADAPLGRACRPGQEPPFRDR